MIHSSTIFLRRTLVSLLLQFFIALSFLKLEHVQADVLLPAAKPPVGVGSTSNSIVLLVEMNTFDPRYQSQLDGPDHYEFQIMTDCDEVNGWKNSSLKALASIGQGFPMTATVAHLTENTCYRFRTRAVFEKGVSSWSFASEDIYTKSNIPLQVTHLVAIAADARSVTVAWKISLQSNSSRDRGGLIDTCFLQYSEDSLQETNESQSRRKWVDHNKYISMIAKPAIVEIQEVTTLVASTSHISSGFFRLKLQISQNKLIKPSNIVSAPIAYNSSAEDFEKALSNIEGVAKIRVFQSYADSLGASPPAVERGSLPTRRGSFTWRVEFLDMSEVFIPLMELHTENLDGIFIPGKARVHIKRLQAGSSATYRSSAQATVTNLEPSTSYSFRVACKNKYGISHWSCPMQDVTTKLDIPPFMDDDWNRIHKTSACIGVAQNANLRLSNLHHESVAVKWTVIQSGTIGSDVTGYEIELSAGREGSANEGGQCSDDFKVVNVKAVNYTHLYMSSEIKRLRAETPYCIRLVAYCRDGSAELSNAVEFSTIQMPSNTWFRLDNYDALKQPEKDQQLRTFHDQYSLCDKPKRPSPRRGHSLTLLNGYIYLFGGLGTICSCKTNYSESCSFSTMHANDLWSFNTMTRTWKLLHLPTTDTLHPMAREQYSATKLANGKILYIGGRTSSSLRVNDPNKLYLGDVWALDPGQIRNHKFHASSTGSIPKSMIDGSILYHSIKPIADVDVGFRESELCVKAITVEVVFEHSCVEEVKRISLVGPRLGWHDSKDSSKGPMNDITLFIGSNPPRVSDNDMKCSYQRTNVTFSDDAERHILDHSYRLPESGHFQAAEPINSQLFGSTVHGAWTLELIDSRMNNKTGVLLEWVLNVETQYCKDGYQWTLQYPSKTDSTVLGNTQDEAVLDKHSSVDSNGNVIFKPRYRHTAMAVGNQVFVMGGRADEIYFETQRFDYETRRWTLLRGANHAVHRPSGQSAVLTPWGLFMLGGLDEYTGHQMNPIVRYEIMSRTWSNITQDESTKEEIPEWRYLTALCYVGNNHLFIHPHDLRMMNSENMHSLVKPTLVLLGGDADLPDHRYLSELWAFSIKEIVDSAKGSGYLERKQQFCENLFNMTDDEYDPWEWSCGVLGGSNSKRVCDWKAISERAWCLDQFQGFYMPH